MWGAKNKEDDKMIEVISKEYVCEKLPTKMCHASTLLRLESGTVLCAWFGGSREGNDDVGIWMSRREEKTWSRPVLLESSKEPHWNPVLFELEKDKIILFYKVGREISRWRTMYAISTDGGITFLKSQELIAGDEGGRGPVRNKPIRLSNGWILAPGSTEQGEWRAFVDISLDNGNTWEKSKEICAESLNYIRGERTVKKEESGIPVSEQSFYGRGVIQPTLWEDEKGVHMLLRSTEGHIYRSDSGDMGKTWTDAYPIKLPNNNSGIDLVKMENKELVLIYNPVEENWGMRSPISLAVSKDGGKTFERIKDLDSKEGEFSYPAVISHNDRVFVSYTYKRENIAFWEIKIS